MHSPHSCYEKPLLAVYSCTGREDTDGRHQDRAVCGWSTSRPTVQEDVQAVHFVCSTIVIRKLEMSHTMEHSTMENLFRYQRPAWCLCLLTH